MQQIVVRTPARMKGAFVGVAAHAVFAQNLREMAAFSRVESRGRESNVFDRTRGSRQQAGHTQFAAKPRPDAFADRRMVAMRGPAPAVPLDFCPVYAHGRHAIRSTA